MLKEQLTINTALRTSNKMQEFIFGAKCQRSNVKCPRTRGFTLVEMIVSLGIFTIVLFIATSAFLAIVNADRKSRATRIAIDNLNLALEDMSRKIKTGTAYGCDGGGDCVAGSVLSFTDQNNKSTVYKRGSGSGAIGVGIVAGGCGDILYTDKGCLLRADETGLFTLATSPEIDISGLKFVVSGSATWTALDKKQPVVVIAIDGVLGANSPSGSGRSAFKIQTTVTQRAYDH